MRRWLLACAFVLLTTPVMAQDPPREGEPIPDPQIYVGALFNIPLPEPDALVIADLPSYTLRVCYLYSRAARGAMSDAQLYADANALRAKAELGFARSRSTGPEILVELAGVATAYDYVESSDVNAYNWAYSRLGATASPYFAWLEAIGCDQPQFISNDGPSAGLGALHSWNKYGAISWAAKAHANSNYTSFHEELHNWGAQHRRADGATNSYFPNGYGWTNGSTKRDILAYCCGTREQISNPDVPFLGTTTPSGTATDNNMSVVHARVATVTAFRGAPAATIPAPRPAGLPVVR
jgi:hypothetical protein